MNVAPSCPTSRSNGPDARVARTPAAERGVRRHCNALDNTERREAMRTSKSMSRYHMTRRAFLGAGIAGAMIATARTGLAQQPAPAPPAPRVKGLRVWQDMD